MNLSHCDSRSKAANNGYSCSMLDNKDVIIYEHGCHACIAQHGENPSKSNKQSIQALFLNYRDAGNRKASKLSTLFMAWSFIASVARYVLAGGRVVGRSVYLFRRSICSVCDHRNGLRCSLCGCFISLKSLFPAERCPASPPRWDVVRRPIYPAGKIGPYHRDDISDVYRRMEDGAIRSSGGCGCSKPKPSLPIIGRDA